MAKAKKRNRKRQGAGGAGLDWLPGEQANLDALLDALEARGQDWPLEALEDLRARTDSLLDAILQDTQGSVDALQACTDQEGLYKLLDALLQEKNVMEALLEERGSGKWPQNSEPGQ